MRRSFNFSQEYDYEQKASQDCHEQVTQMGTMPTVMTNIPHQHHPYDRRASEKVCYDHHQHGGEAFNANHHHHVNHNHQHYHVPQPEKIVQYAEYEKVTEYETEENYHETDGGYLNHRHNNTFVRPRREVSFKAC